MGFCVVISPIVRISWLFIDIWIMRPAHIKSSALKVAWVIRWKNASEGLFSPRMNIIRPSWLKVDSAMIFLRLNSKIALIPAISIVSVPRINIDKIKFWFMKRWLNRIKR